MQRLVNDAEGQRAALDRAEAVEGDRLRAAGREDVLEARHRQQLHATHAVAALIGDEQVAVHIVQPDVGEDEQ